MLALWLSLALASPSTTHEVDLTGGISPFVRTDRQASPLAQEGVLPGFGLAWSARGARQTDRVAFTLATGSLRSGPRWEFTRHGERRDSRSSALTAVDLRYAHGQQLGGERFRAHVGGTLASHMESFEQAAGFTDTATYLGSFDLAPWAELRWDLGKRTQLTVEGWVPLVSWLSRSPYALQDDAYMQVNRTHSTPAAIAGYIGRGGVVSVDRMQSGHLRAGWSVGLTKGLSLLATARLDTLHLSGPLPAVETQLGLGFGVRGSL